MVQRRKISAPYREFKQELEQLKRLDAENQLRLSSGPGNPGQGKISKKQLDLLSEGVFFAAFRSLENLIEDIFLLYALEKKSMSGLKPVSYIKPKDFDHCRLIVKSLHNYLDWVNPDQVRQRSELFLRDGEPIKSIIVNNQSILLEMKYLRNHIAHGSLESEKKYRNVLRDRLATVPVKIPTVGEFLNTSMLHRSSRYHLEEYAEKIVQIGYELAY